MKSLVKRLLFITLSAIIFNSLKAQWVVNKFQSPVIKVNTARKAKVHYIKNYDPNTFFYAHTINPPHRTCGTVRENAILHAKYPQLGTKAEFETWIAKKIKALKKSHQNKSGQPVIYTIPLIFHIINNGEAEGQGTNISEAQVQSQVEVLNEDYTRSNADTTNTPAAFQSVAADCQINFCLAEVDTNGNPLPEPGIDRINRNTMGWSAPPYADTYVDNTIKPATYWNPNEYFNVWVCNLGGGLLGETQFPSQSGLAGMPTNGGPASTDGIMVLYSSIGRPPANPFPAPYNLGRTLTHEMGHALGLRHIWGDDGGACTGSDYCADTPNQADATYGNPTFPQTDACTTTSPGIMFMNFMDYVDDDAMNTFTADQKLRMIAVLENSPRRKQLLTSTVCDITAPPGCNFTASATTVTHGGTVTFTDQSSGNPTSWSWSFPGGTPSTSTAQNPTVTYSTNGTYNVILSACNANGCCHDTIKNYINVVNALGCDTLNYPPTGTLTIYQSSGWGYVSGWNYYGDIAKADQFTNFSPFTSVTGGLIYFYGAHDAGNNAQVQVNIWDNTGAAGAPGNILATETISLHAIDSILTNGTSSGLIHIQYPSPVTVTSTYYMGIKMVNFGAGDSLGIVSNSDGDSPTNMMWEQESNNAWGSYPNDWGGTSLDLFISPLMTDIPPKAVITASDTTICQGDSVTFDGTSSLNNSGYDWYLQGNPSVLNDSIVSQTYNAAGTYYAILKVTGSCSSVSLDTVHIHVSAKPNVTISGTNESCNGDSTGKAVANVTGAPTPYTYTWNTTPVQTTSTASNLPAGNYTVQVTSSNGCSDSASVVISQPSAISLVGATSSAGCGSSNGKAWVIASGGTPGYSYLWNTTPAQTNDTATGLSGGNYEVVVTDNNGCKDSLSLTVSGSGTYISLSPGHQDETCFGKNNGKAWVSVSGTSNPVSYSWNTTPIQTTDTAYNLPQGTYTVSVTDNVTGCSNSDTITIGGPDYAISITSTITNVQCAYESNGSIKVQADGGTPSYTYQWLDGLNNVIGSGNQLNNQAAGSYKVITTDNNGCKDTTLLTIGSPAPLAVTITDSSDALCFGTSTGEAQAAASGGTGTKSYTWNSTPQQHGDSAINLPAGNYSIIVSDSNGCLDTAYVTISQPSQLNVTISSSQNASCFGNSDGQALANVTGGTNPYSYSWNTTPVQTGGGASNLSAGNYKVVVTDKNGCKDSATVAITQPTQIQVSFTTTKSNCGASDGTASASATGGAGGYNYSWSTGSTSSSISNLSSGWYYLTVTDVSGCSVTDSVFVQNSSGSLAATQTHTDVSCNGGANGSATVTPSGGTGAYSYSWNTSPAQTSQTATGLVAGNYIVTITNNGCSLHDTVTVSEPSAINLVGGAVNASCNASNGKAYVTASGGTPNYTYNWETTPTQTTDTAYNLSNGVYTVIVTDGHGCIDSTNVTVSKNVVYLIGTVNVVDATCNGLSDGSASVMVNNGTAPYTYSWSSVPSQTTDTATGLAAGNYVVTVIDTNGCYGTISATVNQPSPISINILSTNPTNSSVCNGQASAYASGGTPTYSYSWTPSNLNGPSVDSLCVGQNCVLVTDANGCTAQSCVTLSALPPCTLAGTMVTINATCYGDQNGQAIAVVSGGHGPLSYSWNDANSQTTDTAIGLSAGSYTVIVTDTQGCSLTLTDSVRQPLPINANLTVNNVSCAGLSNGSISANARGGTSPYSYQWDNGPATPNYDSLSAGSYILIITDAQGCKDTSIAQVNASVALNLSTTFTNADCKLSDGSATVIPNGGNPPYSYQWNDSASQNTSTASNLPFGQYNVYVVDANGCRDSATVIVSENNPLIINGTVQNEQCKGFDDGSISVTVQNGTIPYQYLWSNGGTTSTIKNLGEGAYTVTVVDALGCSVSETYHVGAINNGCINIPNAFTPNGDGDNDVWVLRGKIAYPQIHVQIFNRWGIRIFDSIGYDVPWDGTYNGKKVAAATYYYIIQLGPGLKSYSGSVTVVR